MSEPPCKGCRDRSARCHECCSAYLAYAEHVAKEREDRWLKSLSQPPYKTTVDRAYR